MLHLRRCGGRQCDDGTDTDAVDDRADVAVFRAEIMAPLRYTVSLVNSIERDGHILQEGHIILLGKRLGCDIQQLGTATAHVILHFFNRLLGER